MKTIVVVVYCVIRAFECKVNWIEIRCTFERAKVDVLNRNEIFRSLPINFLPTKPHKRVQTSMVRHEDMTDYGRGVCNEVIVTGQS